MAGKTMKALVLRKHGTLDELEVVGDYPVPQVTDGHVVIRVRASSFNYHDVFTRRGTPPLRSASTQSASSEKIGPLVEPATRSRCST